MTCWVTAGKTATISVPTIAQNIVAAAIQG
jgi:hypothetical protein